MTTRRYVINNINIAGGVVATDCSESNIVSVDIRGVFVGILHFEGSLNGDDWFPIPMVPAAFGYPTATGTDTAQPGAWVGNTASVIKFRVRSSAWTSGNASIQIRASENNFPYMYFTGSGDTNIHYKISDASVNSTLVKNSPGVIRTISVANAYAGPRCFKLFNLSSAPVVGTNIPVLTLLIPARQTAIYSPQQNLRMANGIAYALTSGIDTTDITPVAAADMAIHIDYT